MTTTQQSDLLDDTLSISIPWFVLRAMAGSDLYVAFALLNTDVIETITNLALIEPFRFTLEALAHSIATATFITYTLDMKNNIDQVETLTTGILLSVLIAAGLIASYLLFSSVLLNILISDGLIKNSVSNFFDYFIFSLAIQPTAEIIDRYLVFHHYRGDNFILNSVSEVGSTLVFLGALLLSVNFFSSLALALLARQIIKCSLGLFYLYSVKPTVFHNLWNTQPTLTDIQRVFNMALPLLAQVIYRRSLSVLKVLTKALLGFNLFSLISLTSQILYYPLMAVYALAEASFIIMSGENFSKYDIMSEHMFYLSLLFAALGTLVALCPISYIQALVSVTLTTEIAATLKLVLLGSLVHYFLKGISLIQEKYYFTEGNTELVNRVNLLSSLVFEVLPAVIMIASGTPSLTILIISQIIGNGCKIVYYQLGISDEVQAPVDSLQI